MLLLPSHAQASSITSAAREWMARGPQAKVLHTFDDASYLVDEQRRVLCLVSTELEPVPLGMVIALDRSLAELVTRESAVRARPGRLEVGSLVVDCSAADVWCSRPHWETIRSRSRLLFAQLPRLNEQIVAPIRTAQTRRSATLSDRLHVASAALLGGVGDCDVELCKNGAQMLAGLGEGLTPAGDDYLMGVMHALWAVRSEVEAFELTDPLAECAAPRTTSLSAAWLSAAAQGHASRPWHLLVQALARGDVQGVSCAAGRILAIGQTSGSDALCGFVAGAKALLSSKATS